METQTRQSLMNVADLMGSATLRISRVTRAIRKEALDRLETAGIPADIRCLREEYSILDKSLESGCLNLRDEWPSIQNNRARLYELHMFEDAFNNFTSTVTAFDNAVLAEETNACMFLGEYEASREYAILAARYTDLLRPAFDYEHSIRTGPAVKQTPLQGLCEEMQAYFQGKTDQELEDALIYRNYGGQKGIWRGTLTQATYFGKHFNTTAQVMNRLFRFFGEDNQPRQAHFTKYPADKIPSTDPLATILSKYPHQK